MRHIVKMLLVLSFLSLVLPTVTAQTLTVPNLEIANLEYTTTSPPQSFFVVAFQVNNGICEILGTGFTAFRNIAPGNVNVKFYESDGLTSTCDGTLLKEYNFNYAQGESYTIMIYTDTQNQPAFAFFQNDLSPIPAGQVRVLVRNAVAYQNVTLEFRAPTSQRPFLVSVANGQQATLELPAADWQVSLRNPPPATIPHHFFSQTEPFGAGELWTVEVAGPTLIATNTSGLAIFDFEFSQ